MTGRDKALARSYSPDTPCQPSRSTHYCCCSYCCSSSLTTPPKLGRPDIVINSFIISQISYSRNGFDQDLTRCAVIRCFIYIKFHRHVIQKHKIVYVANLKTSCYVSLVCIYLNKESFRDESVLLKCIRIINSLLV